MTLARGTLVAFDPIQYTATVRFDGATPQALSAIAVSPGIPPSELVAGRRVLIDSGLSGEAGELALLALASGVGAQTVAVLGRTATLLDVVNTAAETSIASVVVPANALRTDRMVRLTLVGDYLNNSGVARTLIVRVKFGATTLYNDVSAALGFGALRRPIAINLCLANQNANNVQVLGGQIDIGTIGGATSGLGDLAVTAPQLTVLSGSAAEDSTIPKTFDITVQHQVAAATISIRRLYALFELV